MNKILYKIILLSLLVSTLTFFPSNFIKAGTDCPQNTVFGQPPHYPENQSTEVMSDEDGTWDPGILHENFSGVSTITDIHFWGFNAYVDYGVFPCFENPMTFEICFYIDSLNRPGRQVAGYTLVIEGDPTGIFYYNDFELMEYDTEIPLVALADGWVSIMAKGGPSCWFFWLSSRSGMDSISIKYGDGTTYYSNDFAFCLLSETSCCHGVTGNTDCSPDEAPDISDITRLIDFLYLSHNPLCCLEEADVDAGGGDPDISDITRLIDFLYLSHIPLPDCP